MAAVVTIATGWPRTNVVGNMRQIMAKMTVTSDADWWVTGLRTIKDVTVTSSGAGVHPVMVSTTTSGTVTFHTDGTSDAAVFCSVLGW